MYKSFMVITACLALLSSANLAVAASNCEILDPDPGFVTNMLAPAAGETSKDRLAFVIGNGAYHASVGPLKNPANDAAAVSQTLQKLGFRVFKAVDASAAAIEACLARLINASAASDVALLYYSGHGIQIDDANYLVATDARLAGDDKKAGLVPVAPIVNRLKERATSLLVFLDACRNSPLVKEGQVGLATGGGRNIALSDARGMNNADAARTRNAAGLYIAYATSPNEVAFDGNGSLSPFTSAFVKHVAASGQPIQRVMAEVTNTVQVETDYNQLPWTRASLKAPLYLNGTRNRDDVFRISDEWAEKARALLNRGERLQAIEAALKGIPFGASAATLEKFPKAMYLLYASVWSRRTVLPDADLARVYSIAILPDRSRVVLTRVSTESFDIELWDTVSKTKLKTILPAQPMKDPAWYVHLSPDGKYIIHATHALVRSWSTADGHQLAAYLYEKFAKDSNVDYSAGFDSRLFAFAGSTFSGGKAGGRTVLLSVPDLRVVKEFRGWSRKPFVSASSGLGIRYIDNAAELVDINSGSLIERQRLQSGSCDMYTQASPAINAMFRHCQDRTHDIVRFRSGAGPCQLGNSHVEEGSSFSSDGRRFYRSDFGEIDVFACKPVDSVLSRVAREFPDAIFDRNGVQRVQAQLAKHLDLQVWRGTPEGATLVRAAEQEVGSARLNVINRDRVRFHQ
jgi:hypothetical protein